MSWSTSSTGPPPPVRLLSVTRPQATAGSSPPADSTKASSLPALLSPPVAPLPPVPLPQQSPPTLHPTLPSAETQRQVAEARAAVVASMSNMLDTSLQGRAATLHAGAAALARQERDVARASDGLRREREKLAREADGAAARLKELGNVQNWAEVLERGFLVVEETLRLVERGEGSECSCSQCGREEEEEEEAVKEDGEASHDDGFDGDDDFVLDRDRQSAWSEASRSLVDPESSMGSAPAKSSEATSFLSAESPPGDLDGRMLGTDRDEMMGEASLLYQRL
ncbi:hypothetical protein XA68_10808 [Ophiocordyceps unilateralis]|uniref:Biogenesis of lysosome-related organelles complex 1 subunit 1 n=1 Tax=Ophiocordyceps unilateralis TaxID=268505 RepID=A0A2A9PGR0_OPHUN|nr:hypothetical protein XA68_10808 [Ophiocordyceps unilateralis]